MWSNQKDGFGGGGGIKFIQLLMPDRGTKFLTVVAHHGIQTFQNQRLGMLTIEIYNLLQGRFVTYHLLGPI